jgi:hypothetical protein
MMGDKSVLSQCDGVPMPEESLDDGLRQVRDGRNPGACVKLKEPKKDVSSWAEESHAKPPGRYWGKDEV